MQVPEKRLRFVLPHELETALREADLQKSFSALPVGKRNRIILWIQEVVRPQTCEKRVAIAIEVAYGAREPDYERRRR
jgi:uncharacterized protein YdeI (YjbR/CyaY-like superfamily)